MLKLYAHPLSPHSRKVHFALEEAGVPYTYQLVDLPKGEQRGAAFRARNAVGKVPVLEDGEFLLPESGAILRYLGENYAPGRLLPTDKHLRARVDQWLFWQPSECNQILHKPFQVKVFAHFAGKPHDEAAYQQAVAACEPVLKHMDDALAGKQYVVGDQLTIADIALVESVVQMQLVDAPLPAELVHLHKWLARIRERPAFQKTRAPAIK
jgi:glutathione S-transferase